MTPGWMEFARMFSLEARAYPRCFAFVFGICDKSGEERIFRDPTMRAERWIELVRHPSTRDRAVRGVAALVQRAASGDLDVRFRLDGDLSHLRIPSPRVPRIAARLWEHTCFEAFLAIDGRPGYHEFNFAPSGEWAAYALRGYRDGAPLADEALVPPITLRASEGRLELEALVRLDLVSAAHAEAPLRLGLSAVIEADDRALSYWALRHPAGKPDFHNAEAFALRLEPPRQEF
jgi:hypothetical protein